MSPAMWNELNLARLRDLQIKDAMQARISRLIASSIPTKKKQKLDEEDFRFFKTVKKLPKSGILLQKFKGIVAAVNVSNKHG